MREREPGKRTDEELYSDYCQGGHAAALEALVARYWERAFGLAYAIVRRASAAEDVAQSAFVRLLRAARRKKDVREFWPWFKTLVLNEARVALRARQRREGHEAKARQLPRQEPAPLDPSAAVRDLTQGLPESLRRPVELHYAAGLTYAEVARVLGCPQGTVCSRLRSAISRMRKSLSARGFQLSSAALVALLEEVCEAAPAAAPASPAVHILVRRSRFLIWTPAVGALAAALIAALTATALILPGSAQRSPDRAARLEDRAPSSRSQGESPSSPDQDRKLAPAASVTTPTSAGVEGGDEAAQAPAAAPSPRPAARADTGVGDDKASASRSLDEARSTEASQGEDATPAPAHQDFRALALSRDGERLISVGHHQVRYWTIKQGSGPELALSRTVDLPIDPPEGQWTYLTAALTYLEDGRVFTVNEKTLYLLAADGRVEQAVPRPELLGGSLLLSPDGARLIDVGRGEVRAFPSLEKTGGFGPSTDGLFSPSGALFVAFKQQAWRKGVVELFDGASLRPLGRIKAPTTVSMSLGPTTRLAFSADERRLYLLDGSEIRGWDLEARREVLKIEVPAEKSFVHISVTPEGRALVVGDRSGALSVYDRESGVLLRTLKGHQGWTLGLACLGKGFLVSGAKDNSLRVWDIRSGQALTRDEKHTGRVSQLVFSRDGRWLATRGGDGCRLWDVARRKQRLKFRGLVGYAPHMVFARDESALLLVRQPEMVSSFAFERWSLETGERDESRPFESSDRATRCRLSSFGELLSYRAKDGRSVLAKLAADPLEPFPLQGLGGAPMFFGQAFSDDQSALAICEKDARGGYQVAVYDTADGRRLKTLARRQGRPALGGDGGADVLFFTPDKKTLVASDPICGTRVWDLETGEERLFAPRLKAWALCPDGRSIIGFSREYSKTNIFGSLKAVRVSLDTMKSEPLGLARVDPRWLVCAALSPDGKVLVLGGDDGELRWVSLIRRSNGKGDVSDGGPRPR